MTRRWWTFMAVVAAGLTITIVAVRSATPSCDNAVLAWEIERIEQLASRSSTMDEARDLAIQTLLQACAGEPAWVGDDLEWEFREDWAPDRTTSGRARWWMESDRVLLLGLDVATTSVDLVVGPEQIYDASNDRVLDPESDEFERRVEELAGEATVAIQVGTRADRLAWSRLARNPEPKHWWVELWMLEARLESGLPVRTRVSFVDRISAESRTLELEREGWRWGGGELQGYERFDDAAAREQRHATFVAGTELVVVLHADVRAARFMPTLEALWHEQTASGDLRPALTVSFE